MCVYVRVCVCACVHACLCVRACVPRYVRVCVLQVVPQKHVFRSLKDFEHGGILLKAIVKLTHTMTRLLTNKILHTKCVHLSSVGI